MSEQTVASQMELVEQLQWRYATKKFDSSKKIDDKTWITLEDALVLTPSSYGLQPWKFVVVTDQSIKDKLPEHSFQQPQPKDCSHLVVISRLNKLDLEYVDKYVKAIADTRGLAPESLDSYKGMMTGFVKRSSEAELEQWMTKQCYIALGNLMTSAALLNVDACPMEGFNKAKYDEILKLDEQGINSVVLCAMGYRASDDKYAEHAKVRHSKNTVLHYV